MPNDVYAPRSIVEEPGFLDSLVSILGSQRRADELMEAIGIVIARSPQRGTPVGKRDDLPVYALRTLPTPAWPGVLLLYSSSRTSLYMLQAFPSSGSTIKAASPVSGPRASRPRRRAKKKR